MARQIGAFDWTGTPLGPIDLWPASLRAVAAMVLENRFPMAIWWGQGLCNLYNDAYAPVLGGKHPWALGRPAAEVWSDIWDILGPQAEHVMSDQGATWNEHLLLPMKRKGFLEETYFTFSYSPVRDDNDAVAGLLITCQETTVQVQSDRQLRMLRDLGARAMDAKSAEDACRTAAQILETNDADLPFSLLYLRDERGEEASLAACAGLDGHDGPARARTIDLRRDDGRSWPLGEAQREAEIHVVDGLERRFGALPGHRWGPPPRQAVVLRLAGPGQHEPYGFLVAGVSPVRPLDERYRALFRLTADQVAAAIGSARAFEDERRRAESLAEIDRAKTAFFSNVSHEFRTPLTLMLGPTEDLLSGVHGELSEAQRGQLELIRRNELRLQRLVNALLEFSRIEAGRIQAAYEPTDLSALTRDLASAFRAAVERAGLRFTVDCPPLDEPVFVDRDMWEQIVLNLLSNAFKFTFEGEIAVTLRAPGGEVALEVKDSGVGISAEDVPRLFDRFHRVEGTRARTHEGSGIGLALVQELAKLHGGGVRVESRLGAGTSFTVVVPKGSRHLPADKVRAPRSQAPAAPRADAFVEEALRWLPSALAAQPGAAADRAGSEGRPAPAARIVVADDNADMRDYVRKILEPHWTVEVAENGAAALELILARPPDLVLSDVMMPGLDGFGLLRELRRREDTKAIPVVILSARAGEEARVGGLMAGADDYLVKPFSARELVARVRAHIEIAHLRRAAELERNRLRSLLGEVPAIIDYLEEERRTAEDARATAESIVRARDEFLTIASHELRTPLTALGLQLDGLLRGLNGRADGDPQARRWRDKAARARGQADRLEQLVENMVEAFRLARERVELDCREGDLAEIIRGSIERLRADSRYVHAAIDLSASPVVGCWDPARVDQVALHLLDNAVKFGSGKVIHVGVEETPEGARLIVADHGIGVAPEHHERIFGRFERVASVTSYGGFGLGLWIVRRLVIAMRGSVRVESEPGQGSRFIVELPRRA